MGSGDLRPSQPWMLKGEKLIKSQVKVNSVLRYTSLFFCWQLYCLVGISSTGNSSCFPLGKPAETESRYPTYGTGLVFYFMDYEIFNVRMNINACDCTWGCTAHRKRVCTASWLWEKNPFPHRGNRSDISGVTVQRSASWTISPPFKSDVELTGKKEKERQNSWQQAKHSKLYSNLLQAWWFWILGRMDLNFCVRGTRAWGCSEEWADDRVSMMTLPAEEGGEEHSVTLFLDYYYYEPVMWYDRATEEWV